LAGGVGGGGPERSTDGFYDAIDVSENFMIPKPGNLETLALQPLIPLLVLLFLDSVLTTVYFN